MAPLTEPVMTWRTEGPAGLPDPQRLTACLARFGGPPPAVGQTAPNTMDVVYAAPPLRQRVEPAAEGAPGLRGRTAVSGHPHAALAAHLALAACLAPEATALVDVDLGRRFTAEDWPQPTVEGGLAVPALFTSEAIDTLLVTRGLNRVGLPELALEPGPHESAESAKHRLETALATVVVAEKLGETLTVGDVTYTVVPRGLTGVAQARLLVPPPEMFKAAASSARRGGGAVMAPRSAPSAPSGSQAPKVHPAPPTRPVFMPDYR